ncbi:MAG TPA: hypothetical protein ENF87_03385 [Thermoproteales archaeon]|nr:hypothetical protein [Thermoproteales archaeon]
MRCSYCGAEFEVPENVVIAVCPYCGTSVITVTGEKVKEHYVFRLNYDFNIAFKKLLSVISKEIGVPRDLTQKISIKERRLHYIPLYIYRIEVYAVLNGKKISEEVKDIATLAVEKTPVPVPLGYKFPVRGKEYFNPEIVKKGVYYSPTLNPEKVLEKVEEEYKGKVLKEAELELGSSPLETGVKIVSKSRYLGFAIYPFWEIVYTYEKGEYRGFVDGADGIVIYSEYPKKFGKRPAILLTTLLTTSTLIGFITPLAIYRNLQAAVYGLIGGLLVSTPSLVKLLSKSFGSKGEYFLEVEKIGISEEIR